MRGRVSCARAATAGLTLVEVTIALAVFALIGVNVVMISRSGATAARTGTLMSVLNDELSLTMERMELALMAAHSDEVQSVNAFPLYSSRVDFAVDVGVDNGSVVLGDPERIEWSPIDATGGRIAWRRNPESPDERAVTWSRSVPTVHKNEVGGNNADDNGNGLKDEGGLAFTLPNANRDMVEIHLTVERSDQNGKRVGENRTVRITCRN